MDTKKQIQDRLERQKYADTGITPAIGVDIGSKIFGNASDFAIPEAIFISTPEEAQAAEQFKKDMALLRSGKLKYYKTDADVLLADIDRLKSKLSYAKELLNLDELLTKVESPSKSAKSTRPVKLGISPKELSVITMSVIDAAPLGMRDHINTSKKFYKDIYDISISSEFRNPSVMKFKCLNLGINEFNTKFVLYIDKTLQLFAEINLDAVPSNIDIGYIRDPRTKEIRSDIILASKKGASFLEFDPYRYDISNYEYGSKSSTMLLKSLAEAKNKKLKIQELSFK